MAKKRNKIKPEDSLKLSIFPLELEQIVRELYDLACCGSKKLWPIDVTTIEGRNQFLSSSHAGMRRAQERIVERIKDAPQPDEIELLLLRGIADAIAWQILGYQLCYARRLFVSQQPPNLNHCNLDSAIFVAKKSAEDSPDSMPLISDLTSFVQVGDVLNLDPSKGITINEIKEGDKNQYLLEFIEFIAQAQCERAVYHFVNNESKSTVKQFERMLRQHDRMHHVSDVIGGKQSKNPDTGQIINIRDEPIIVDDWFDRLQKLCEQTDDKSWAIDVIDDCLFLGCYSQPPIIYGGHLMFLAWFNGLGGNDQCPTGTAIDSMKAALALPIFNWFIKDEHKFDFLFGRKHLCIGISIDKLLEQCKKEGIGVRFGSNKEATQIQQRGAKPFKYNKKIIFLSYCGNETVLMDGIFMRIMFHAQTPISTIKAMLSSIDSDKIESIGTSEP
jgi:hypothetical protein